MSDGRHRQDAPDDAGQPRQDESPEEPALGGLPTDPELEAALRAAVEAIPDEEPEESDLAEKEAEAEAKGESATPEGEVLLEEPLEEGPPDLQIRRLRQQVTESNDRLIRLQADFENFRKRAYRDRQDVVHYGHQNLVKDLLSVVDNLDRAIGHARRSGGADLQSFLQGVELVRRELLAVFEKYSVTEIDALGKSFDPALHEAMAQVADETTPANTVVEVLEKGYQLRDRLVRPARVVVTKAADEPSGGDGGGAAG